MHYDLPPQLIATRPAEPRDSARLLVVHLSAESVEHAAVRDLPQYLQPDDHLILNDTAVIPARFFGHRIGTGGRIEGLFLEARPDGTWRVLLRSGGTLRDEEEIGLFEQSGAVSEHRLRIMGRDGASGFILKPSFDEDPFALLNRLGHTPLPPYISRARHGEKIDDANDRSWYQTVFADPSHRESVAAPTAGLHFTESLLDEIRAAGVGVHRVTLSVGPGTFQPIKSPTLAGHHMHAERWHVSAAVMRLLAARSPQSAGSSPIGRLIAVGTTSVRTLESLPQPLPEAIPGEGLDGFTRLFITPGYGFRFIDGLLTNFHLPRSTLLALVGALLGIERTLAIYREAVRRRYRFYSYGDAMLILP